MSWWWQVYGIGIVELVVFIGIGIFVLVKLHKIRSATKYEQSNNKNNSHSINRVSNHNKMPNNDRIIRKHISQDMRNNRSKDTEYYNGKDILPILHNQNTISGTKSNVNHNRGEPTLLHT